MAAAGHPTKVYVKATNAAAVSGDEVAGIKSCTNGKSVDLLDITTFKDTSGWRQRMNGLLDGTVEMSGLAEFADAPQNLIRSSMLSGASIWVTIEFNPTGSAGQKGVQVECKVASYEFASEMDGTVDFSASFQFTAAPVDV